MVEHAVIISGSNFLNVENISCKFGAIVVKAEWISMFLIRCISPQQIGSVRLAVSNNGIDFSSSNVEFTYQPRMILNRFLQHLPRRFGGTLVSVSGTNLRSYGHPSCHFGDTHVVDAMVVSETLIKCITPRVQKGGIVKLYISHNGIDRSKYFLNFTFKHDMGNATDNEVQIDLLPRRGPMNGGTNVVISGLSTSFMHMQNLSCKFGSTSEVPATKISDGKVECTSPPHEVGIVPLQILSPISRNHFQQVLYIFDKPVFLQDFTPTAGTVRGDTTIYLHGENFVADDMLQCRFGDTTMIKATYLSSKLITCVTPASFPSTKLLSVTQNGQYFVKFSKTFDYLPEFNVFSTNLFTGSVNGGTEVSIFGTGFTKRYEAACSFGSKIVQAHVINDTNAWCLSPSQESIGTVPVEISLNGVDFTDNYVLFHYTEPSQVLSIRPQSGSMNGGTKVFINGTNFNSTGTFKCAFGDRVVEAEFVSPSSITCISPSGHVGRVSVEVTSNGVDYTTNFVQYTYRLPVRLVSVYPTSGPESGGTEIRIVGMNFVDALDLKCRFSGLLEKTVNARYISSGAIVCTAPELIPGEVKITVISNGFDETAESLSFTVYPFEFIERISPSRGVISGGTSVSIVGGNYIFSSALSCSFDSVMVPASFISDSKINCFAPARSRSWNSESEGYK